MKNAKDPGAELAMDIELALEQLDFNKEAEDDLLKALPPNIFSLKLSTLLQGRSLPDHIEELFTLRGDRYLIFLISGIQQTHEKKSIGFVTVSFPLMPWEWVKYTEEEFEDDNKPEWVPNIDPDYMFDFYYDVGGDIYSPQRFYHPVLAEYIRDPFADKKAYRTRREIIAHTIELLHNEFGFCIRYSESGDIPKEIRNKWLCKEMIEDYNDYLTLVTQELENDPKDPDLWFERAGLLLSRERAEEALECLENALQYDSISPKIWYLLSDVYAKLDRDAESEAADARARAIQKELGTPENKADIYYLLNPELRVIGDFPEKSRLPKKERLECSFCQYDFLYIKEGIWYACNGCGHEDAIANASMEVKIRSDNRKIEPPWFDKVILEVTFTNKTKYEIELSTENMELCLDTVSEISNDELSDTDPFCFALMPKPYTIVNFEPYETKNAEIALKDVIWNDQERLMSTKPGKYALFLFVVSKIGAGWEDMNSVSESNKLLLNKL